MTVSQKYDLFIQSALLRRSVRNEDFSEFDMQEESIKIITRHLLVQKRLNQEIEMLKEDVEEISEKIKFLDNEQLM